MSDRSGFVYLIKSVTGHWKIGRTINPHDRATMFNVKLPIEVSLDYLIQCDDMIAVETRLHKLFKSKRVNASEWYALDEQDVAYIKANYQGCDIAAIDVEVPMV